MNKNQTIGKVALNVGIVDRAIMLILYIISILSFIIFQIYFGEFIAVPLVKIFDSHSFFSTPYTEQSYLRNALLYLTFYVQHILMATIFFKIKISKMLPKYILYERYIFNILSVIILITIIKNVKPIYNNSQIMFIIPLWVSLPLNIIGQVGFFTSLYKLGGDLLSPFSFKDIIKADILYHPRYSQGPQVEIVDSGIYGICRHPMQGSTLLIFFFSSNIFTVDRLIFILVNTLGIVIGVLMQESRLQKKIKGYQQYKKKVNSMFIPYIF